MNNFLLDIPNELAIIQGRILNYVQRHKHLSRKICKTVYKYENKYYILIDNKEYEIEWFNDLNDVNFVIENQTYYDIYIKNNTIFFTNDTDKVINYINNNNFNFNNTYIDFNYEFDL